MDFFKNIINSSDKSDASDVNFEGLLNTKIPEEKRIYHSNSWYGGFPIRQILLWGRDSNGQKAFLILYGKHKGRKKDNYTYILDEVVSYTNYILISGSNNHFPCVFDEHIYISYNDEIKVQTSYKCSLGNNKIDLPYYLDLSYDELAKLIKRKNIDFSGFHIVSNPNEIIHIEPEYSDYFSTVCEMMSNQNIYNRKKLLGELVEARLNLSFYEDLIDIGSAELVSGIFLEFAKAKDGILSHKAKEIYDGAPFDEKGYFDGVKRCIDIYLNSIDDEKKASRSQFIRDTLSNMDLNLIYLEGENIDKSKILSSETYRRYSLCGKLRTMSYVYKSGNWEQQLTEIKYKKGIYTDGRELDIIAIKNTIQEAECYDLPDVIGKVAYYMDSPRLVYYFKGNIQTKARWYFARYLRRIMDNYAKTAPNKFIISMKTLLCSYKKEDYLSKFKDNFQYNYFIKYYLYHDFDIKAPEIYYGRDYQESYKIRKEFIRNDQFLKYEGRFELYKEIWNEHIKDVLDIAVQSEVTDIIKFCYYILLEAYDEGKPHNKLEKLATESQVTALSESTYLPMSDLFSKILSNNLAKLEHMSDELLISLLNSKNKNLLNIGIKYLQNSTDITVELLIKLLLQSSREKWFDVWKDKFYNLDDRQYISFITKIVEQQEEFLKLEMCDNSENGEHLRISEESESVLYMSVSRINDMEWSLKYELFVDLCEDIFGKRIKSELIVEFVERGLLSYSLIDIKTIIKNQMAQYLSRNRTIDKNLNDRLGNNNNTDSKIETKNNELFIKNSSADKVEVQNQRSIEASPITPKQYMDNNSNDDNSLDGIDMSDRRYVLIAFRIKSIIVNERNNRILCLFNAIYEDTIPDINDIMDIIDRGSDSVLHLFVQIVDLHKDKLLSQKEILLLFLESKLAILNRIAQNIYAEAEEKDKKELLFMFLDSPVKSSYNFALREISRQEVLENLFADGIPKEWLSKLLEHTSKEIKYFTADRISQVIETFGNGDIDLFMYYAKTILYMPNKLAKSKQKIYNSLPEFVARYPKKRQEIEEILLDIGTSNIKADSEKSLVTYAKLIQQS